MGAWGTGLYQDDTMCDIKEDYLDLLKVGDLILYQILNEDFKEHRCYKNMYY